MNRCCGFEFCVNSGKERPEFICITVKLAELLVKGSVFMLPKLNQSVDLCHHRDCNYSHVCPDNSKH